MPFQIANIDNLLQISLTGVVTGVDLDQAAAAAREYESGPIVPHRLTDLTGAVGLNLTFESVWALAARRRALRFPNAFKSAIVAPQPSQLGFARMFQTLNDNPQITIQIFADKTAALQWIAAP
jgi:hypothetical protein